jgi:hypothetical protein
MTLSITSGRRPGVKAGGNESFLSADGVGQTALAYPDKKACHNKRIALLQAYLSRGWGSGRFMIGKEKTDNHHGN